MNKQYSAIILAAGSSTRLGLPQAKQFLSYKNMPLYMQSLELFRRIPYISSILIALPPHAIEAEKDRIAEYAQKYGIICSPIAGGASRIQSMQYAFAHLSHTCTGVFIHDAARPFCTPEIIERLHSYLEEHDDVDGVIPVLPVKDTIKQVEGNKVKSTLERDSLVQVQTPQYFRYVTLQKSLLALAEGTVYIDDASLLEAYGATIHTIAGDERNMKITTPHDLTYITKETSYTLKTTMGYDVHAYGTEGRDYIIAGIHIDTLEKLIAHSDGDVVLHALIDALLALTDKGDIGSCFPDTESAYEGIASSLLLHQVQEIINSLDITLVHIDITIVAQAPKLQPYMKKMKSNIAYLLRIKEQAVSIKATTEEHLGFTGRKEGVKAYVLVSAHVPIE